MPRATKGYKRPISIDCLICGGPVAVLPVGTIGEGHAACMLIRRDLARLQGDLDLAAIGRTEAELAQIAAFLAGELQQARNAFVNKYANPAKRAKARKV